MLWEKIAGRAGKGSLRMWFSSWSRRRQEEAGAHRPPGTGLGKALKWAGVASKRWARESKAWRHVLGRQANAHSWTPGGRIKEFRFDFMDGGQGRGWRKGVMQWWDVVYFHRRMSRLLGGDGTTKEVGKKKGEQSEVAATRVKLWTVLFGKCYHLPCFIA